MKKRHIVRNTVISVLTGVILIAAGLLLSLYLYPPHKEDSSKMSSDNENNSTGENSKESTTVADDMEVSGGLGGYRIAGKYQLPHKNYKYQYGYTQLSAPRITEELPNRSCYPVMCTDFSISMLEVNETLYFVDQGELYCSVYSEGNWKAEKLGIADVTDIVSAGDTIFCLRESDTEKMLFLYNTLQKQITKQINLNTEVTNGVERNFMLHCADKEHAYLSGYKMSVSREVNPYSKDYTEVLSIDQQGNMILFASYVANQVVMPAYVDQDYYVYAMQNPDGTECGLYVKERISGKLTRLCDQITPNLNNRTSIFNIWNGKFVYMIEDKGICVQNPDGSDKTLYKGSTESGYVLVGDKIYFADHELYSLNLKTGQQEIYDYGDDADFKGQIRQFGKYLVLARSEGESNRGGENYETFYLIPIDS